MDSNTHSTGHPTGTPTGLSALVAELQELTDHDPDQLPDGAGAERVMVFRGLAWTAWKATGWPNSLEWTPGGPPAPTRASRSAPPPGGCATAST